MTGEPGKAVEGGWTFTNPEGSYELVYKADELGFQPEAAHIPVPVVDTNEVTGAKTEFYSLYDEHKAKVEAGFLPEDLFIPDTNEVVEAKNKFYSLVEEHKAKVEAAIAKDAAEAVVDARRKRSPNDVFRYEDEATGQSHYMTGEPGMAVEGGWTFTNPEGSYELVYKADEGGFQPEAAHIPVSVEDTNEVTEAKTAFYSLYDEHKAKVEAAIAKDAVVDARRKRDAHGFYNLHPYHAAAKEGEEVKEFKFLPYHGFVPADEMVKGEEQLLKSLHPYHKKMTEKRFKLDPYYGFVPVEEEPKEVKEFKFLPYHGFVPADETVPGEEALLKNLHPYHKKMTSKKFKLDPYHGFVPIMEEEAPAAVSERKKRDVMDMSMEKSQDLTLPPPPHPYNFHPFLGLGGVKPEDSENKLYKYVPYYGFVPAEGKADEEDPEAEGEDEEKEEILYKYDPLYGFVKADDEIKPLEEQEYKYTPYVGFVPATGDEDEDVKTYKFNPFYGFVEKTDEDNEETAEEMSEQQYKFVPFYGFVPVNEDGEVEETAKNYGNLKYTFHPYYGFLPTPTDGEVEQQLYKLDPVVGFYPSEKEDTEETELDAKRKKRDAQFFVNPVYQPVYQPVQQVVYVPVIPTITEEQTGKTAANTDEAVEDSRLPLYPGSTGPIVTAPFFGNQFLFRYPLNSPVAALPESQYPVIPHDPEDAEQGPVEF